MTRSTGLSLFGNCPNCGMEWGYEHTHADGETRQYSRLVGMVSHEEDRLIYYFCPECETEFKREDIQHR